MFNRERLFIADPNILGMSPRQCVLLWTIIQAKTNTQTHYRYSINSGGTRIQTSKRRHRDVRSCESDLWAVNTTSDIQPAQGLK
jgi:hypothetical protein